MLKRAVIKEIRGQVYIKVVDQMGTTSVAANLHYNAIRVLITFNGILTMPRSQSRL